MEDPSKEIVEVEKQVKLLSKLMRDAYSVPTTEIIASCQSIKSNISYVEDWAWRKGNKDD